MIMVVIIVGWSPPEVTCATVVALNKMESRRMGALSLARRTSKVCSESASCGDTKKVVNVLFCCRLGMNTAGVCPSMEYVEMGGLSTSSYKTAPYTAT